MIFVHGGPQRQMLPGLPLHAVLSLGVRGQSVARQSGLRGDVDQLPQRHRLRPQVPHRAQHLLPRQLRVPGCDCRRRSTCRRAPTSTPSVSASGDCRTAGCSPRRRSRATPTSSSPAPTSPACISRATRSIRRRSVSSRPRSRRSTSGSRRSFWCRATTIATSTSRRWSAWCSLLRARNVYYELTVIPDDVHESLVHWRWIDVFGRMGDFMKRFVWNGEMPPRYG